MRLGASEVGEWGVVGVDYCGSKVMSETYFWCDFSLLTDFKADVRVFWPRFCLL
jgi:hypothetical protein